MTGVVDFTVEQEKFYRKIIWRDGNSDVVNLTGYKAEMSLKTAAGATSVLDLVSGVAVNATGIIITPAAGQIEITISGVDMETIAPGSYKYDLILFTPDRNTVVRLIKGKFKITAGITVPPVV